MSMSSPFPGTARGAGGRSGGAVALGAPRVLVVGGGIAGLGAALRLAERGCAVELLERGRELGGACRGIEVPTRGGGATRIDGGVSDFNRRTFTALRGLLEALGLPLTPVCQDASFRRPDGAWVWSSGEEGATFAPGVDPGVVDEIARFRRTVVGVVDPAVRAGDWLTEHRFSEGFRASWFRPRAAGCFPSPELRPEDMPLRSLVRFWAMHGIVGPGPADRVTVTGGMHRYVPVLADRLRGLGVGLHLEEGVERVFREGSGVALGTTRGRVCRADEIVFATCPSTTLAALGEPTVAEREVLGSCTTQPGRVVVHADRRLMPRERSRWAAYNYLVPDADRVGPPTVTFWPARLGRLPADVPDVFVTLNPPTAPRHVVAEAVLTHPVFGRSDAVAHRLAALQGARRTWYCGSWVAEPYLHETALRSGLDVADALVDGVVDRAGRRWRATA